MAVIDPDPQDGSPLSVNAYDPVLDSWRNIPVPSNVAFTPRINPYLGVVTGKLIVYGGSADPDSGTGYLTDGWVIDLNDLTWTPMTSGPEFWPAEFNLPRVFADGSRAVFIPAEDYIGANNVDVAVATYDVSTQTWETAPSPSSTNGSFGCNAPAWNDGQALCQSAGFLYTVTSSPLTVVPFLSIFDIGAQGVVFSPVGDMFLGFESGGGEAPQGVFWVDPNRQTWGAYAQIPFFVQMAATVNGQVLVWNQGSTETTTDAGTVNVSLDAEVFDPVAGVWSPVTCTGAPTWPIIGVTVATPSGLIVFDGSGSPTGLGVLEL